MSDMNCEIKNKTQDKKYFVDNYIGLIIITIFSVIAVGLYFSNKQLSQSLLRETFFDSFLFIFIGLSILITARTGSVNFSAYSIGFASLSILVSLKFSVLSWFIVIALVMALSYFFTLLQKKWGLPLMLLAPTIHMACNLIILFADNIPTSQVPKFLRSIGNAYIGSSKIPLIVLFALLASALVFIFLRFYPTIQVQRKGERVSYRKTFDSQLVCLLLGITYALLYYGKELSFPMSVPTELNYDFQKLIVIFTFCFCSQKLDNKIAPVFMVIIGTIMSSLFELGAGVLAFNGNIIVFGIIVIGIGFGAMFLNRVYRIKGWYFMAVMNLFGLTGFLVLIAAAVYQAKKGLKWGDWIDNPTLSDKNKDAILRFVNASDSK